MDPRQHTPRPTPTNRSLSTTFSPERTRPKRTLRNVTRIPRVVLTRLLPYLNGLRHIDADIVGIVHAHDLKVQRQFVAP